jgi:hypothetical protein
MGWLLHTRRWLTARIARLPQNQIVCNAAQMNEAIVGTMLLASTRGFVASFDKSELELARAQW